MPIALSAARAPTGEIPYLHVRETEGAMFPLAFEITGNAKALLRLRKQIDRALQGVERFPFDDTLYRDVYEEEYEVVVRRAKSREEMELPPPERKEAPEPLPWAERALRQETERRERERRGEEG